MIDWSMYLDFVQIYLNQINVHRLEWDFLDFDEENCQDIIWVQSRIKLCLPLMYSENV